MPSPRLARLLLAAALLVPAAARAQDRGAFVIVSAGRDTILIERFVRTADSVSAMAELTGRARMAITLRTTADAAVTAAELRAWPANAAPDAPAPQTGSIVFAGDSVAATLKAGAMEPRVVTVRNARGALPLINPSAVLMEQMLMRARALSPRDSVALPVVVVGTTQSFAARVRWIGADSAVLSLGPVDVRARVDAAGRMLGAVVPAQSLTIVRVAEARSVAVAPPDYTAPAGAPYTATDVWIPHPGGFRLAGTLTLPKERSGRVPAVVTITGSGQQDRDESIPMVAGYRIFRQVADTLGRRGIAVLRFDDRAFGRSGGSAMEATSRDFASDVAAVVAYLRTRPEIDPDRIALVGHSEGGIIAPMVATDDPKVRAVVLIAGTSRSGQRILDYQVHRGVDSDPAIPVEKRDSAYRAAWESLGTSPWITFFTGYDPLPTAARIRQPVLILQGATDRQVTADQAPELEAAIRGGGNRDVTMRVFPDLNHLMVHDPSGDPAGYSRLPSGQVSPELLGTLADWLATRLR